MAATLFQIRRGSGSISLVDGEIFLHKGSGSLQIGSGGSNVITLAKLNDINSGSLYLGGDITASNAYFSGDVAISGNLFLGNNTGDNISVPGVFTTNLVPGTNGAYDLGTTGAKWRTLWVNSVSASFTGSVNGIDVTSLSNRLNNIENFTSSITGGVNKLGYFNTEKSLISYPNSYLGSQTFGLGTSATNSVAPERLMVDNSGVASYNIATFQTSQNESYAQVNIKNFGSGSVSSTDLVIWNDVATESSSYVDLGINSSNYSAGNVGYGGDGYLINAANDLYIGSTTTGSHGHLHLFSGNNWKSSSISVYQDGTIGVNTDKFDNNSSTIPTSGFAVEISGGVKFDNDIHIVGNISSSIITSLQVATASLNTHSASVNTKFTNLATITGSLILTASANTISIANLNSYTSSLNSAIQLTGSTVSFLGDIVVYGTQSILHSTNLAIDDNIIYLNGTSSVTNIDLGIIGNYNDGTYAHTGIFRSATDGAWRVFKGYQPEISGTINLTEPTFQLADFKANDISGSTINGLGNATVFSSSIATKDNNLATITGSLISSASTSKNTNDTQDVRLSNIETFSGSQLTQNTNLATITGSLILTSSANTISVTNLNLFSGSQLTQNSSLATITGSLISSASTAKTTNDTQDSRLSNLETFSGSQLTQNNSLATITGSLILTASVNVVSITNLNTETASLESRATTLAQVTASLKTFTASVNTYTSSTDHRLDLLEYTASISVGAGLAASFDRINTWTASTDTRIAALELYSASYAQYFTYSGSQFHIDFNV